MADLTAIILTRNEEDYIVACIESIKLVAKRIVVVDSFSEDKTVSIAQGAGAEVHQHEFYNYAKQYMYAVEIADVKTTWILRIDADERLTKESAAELEKLCNENENTDVSGIVLRFYNMFLGKPMMHGGMYPWKKLSVYKAGIGNVAMFCYPEEYQLGIRPMNKDDIIEVDNLSELIALDASYKKYVEEK